MDIVLLLCGDDGDRSATATSTWRRSSVGVLAGQLVYILVGVVVIGAALSHLMGEIIERPLKRARCA